MGHQTSVIPDARSAIRNDTIARVLLHPNHRAHVRRRFPTCAQRAQHRRLVALGEPLAVLAENQPVVAVHGLRQTHEFLQQHMQMRRLAQILAADPLALRALYHWGVWYRTVDGDVYLPVGYGT